MDYQTLPPSAFAEMRVQRLQALETQHFRLALQDEDAAGDEERASVREQMADLERRCRQHREVIELERNVADERSGRPDDDQDTQDKSGVDEPGPEPAMTDRSE